jgi:metal-sulfur cluster biosynthetic enzyme
MNASGAELDNPNPTVRAVIRDDPAPFPSSSSSRPLLRDIVFDVVRDIRDPEHDHSLEALSVVDRTAVVVRDPPDDGPGYGTVTVTFTPTVPHCSMASVIGLSIKAKLDRTRVLRDGYGEHYYKLAVLCAEGAHTTAESINKQLADKERVAAAFENPTILSLLETCINNLPL